MDMVVEKDDNYNIFIKECIKLDKEDKSSNLNYMKKIVKIEYEKGIISKNVYDKYMDLKNNKEEWNYYDWCLYLGKKP